LSTQLFALLLCALLLADLGYVNLGAARHNDKIYLWLKQKRNTLDGSLEKNKELSRVGSYDYGMGPNIEMYFGLQTVGGYTPLFLYRYYEYITHYTDGKLPDGWVWFSYNRSKNRILMDLLNVKYEISYDSMKFKLRKTYLPRAFIVPGYEIIERGKVLDSLTSPDFEPTQTILFEKDEFKSGVFHPASNTKKIAGQATVVAYRPDNILVETRSSGPGLLFLSEAFYPGWKAFVDDKPKPILRGNYLFRVVEVPKGHHRVRFIFDPLSIKVGIGLTIFSLFIILITFLYHIRERVPFLKQN
jgi:hypothetical protein